MFRQILWGAGIVLLVVGKVDACPGGQSRGTFGWCYPNAGGEVGKAWEKGKREIANFERDARTWIETGKCGGDICDAFAAVVDFGKSEIEDMGTSLKNAGERISTGKHIDALWHLSTDSLNNTQENAADAARRSRVLQATGQVAASVYGGPGGAAAYTSWLTYNATGNVADALKAGIISGATAAALGKVSKIELTGASGVAAKGVLIGAVNGAAVAAAGGTRQDIQGAFGWGIATVLIREGYKELTDLNLDEQRLRSSTGDAYCLAKVPTLSYVKGGVGSGCFGPPSAYSLTEDGTAVQLKADGKPLINFGELDPDRPHVGLWANDTTPFYNQAAENSGFMTAISRLPGWNAMAVAHDIISDRLDLSLIPTVASIPPSVVLTYMGSGYNVHDMIRDAYLREKRNDPGSLLLPPVAPLQEGGGGGWRRSKGDCVRRRSDAPLLWRKRLGRFS